MWRLYYVSACAAIGWLSVGPHKGIIGALFLLTICVVIGLPVYAILVGILRKL